MPHRPFPRAVLAVAALAAACGLAALPASAAGTKVPNGDQIKDKIKVIYNGKVPTNSAVEREKVFIEVERILQKDAKQNVAMKTPEFWVEAAQEGRFATGGERKLGKKKETVSEDMDFGTEGKPRRAKIWYRAGGLLAANKPCPLIVSILPADVDPKAWIDQTWAVAANDDIVKNWVVVAIADSPEFPVTKEPILAIYPFLHIRDRFAVDANRWYLEGVGGVCDAVQTAASRYLPTRLTGLVLRGPEKAVANVNSKLFPTLVVHSKTSDKAAAVAQEYQKIEADAEAIVLDDVNLVKSMTDQVLGWFAKHARRVVPTSYTYTSTITETEGEQWTGSMEIVSPSKRGVPTTVTVKYLRDKGMVDIQCENLDEFVVYMNDELLDLDKPVDVWVNGSPLAEKRVFERSLRPMLSLADSWGEWGRMFPAQYRGVVPTNMTSAAAPGTQDPNAPAPPGGDGKPPVEPPAPPK